MITFINQNQNKYFQKNYDDEVIADIIEELVNFEFMLEGDETTQGAF